MADRYDVVTSRKDKDGKWRSTRIGAAFPAKDGKDGFNIVLDALPMPNGEGQAWLTLFPFKPKEDSEHHDQRPISERAMPKRPDPISSGRNRDLNDDVPF
jgi:hypothetical protein